MRWSSRLFMPVTSKKNTKIHDRGLARLVQGGYALWNPNDRALILLPEGKRLFHRAESFVLSFLEDLPLCSVETWGSRRGALDAAVRLIKRKEDVPVLFAERSGTSLNFLGLTAGEEESGLLLRDFLAHMLRLTESLELPARILNRPEPAGGSLLLAIPSQEPQDGMEGLACPRCGLLAAFDSTCRHLSVPESGEAEPLSDVPTPDCPTVEELCGFLQIPREKILKCMIYAAASTGNLIAVILRSDREVSLEKLSCFLGEGPLRPANAEEIAAHLGNSAGYLGPVGLPPSVRLVADSSAIGLRNMIIGANKKGWHRRGACWGRDFSTDLVGDVTLLKEGDRCPQCGTPFQKQTLRILGTCLPRDPLCAADPSLTCFDGRGKVHLSAWSASVDLTSLISAVLELRGTLPAQISPADAWLYWEGEGAPPILPSLVGALEKSGKDVIIDNRSKSPELRKAEAEATGIVERICLKKDGESWIVERITPQGSVCRALHDFIGGLASETD